MADTDSLRELAKAALPEDEWYTVEDLTLHGNPDLPAFDAAYIAAASPDVVLALLDGRDEWQTRAHGSDQAYRRLLDERDALRAALRALVEWTARLEANYDGLPSHALRQARAVLTPRAEQAEDAATEDTEKIQRLIDKWGDEVAPQGPGT